MPKINQEEYEKLDSKWIDEHEIYIHDSNRSVIKAVPVDDLKNLLVPNQEELEVKIQGLIEDYQLAFEDTYGELENGWISGFIKDLKNLVEEEPLYYVIDESRRPLLKVFKNKVSMTICNLTVEEIEALKHPNLKYRLTEKQIKDYDECYWAFAVPVEVGE